MTAEEKAARDFRLQQLMRAEVYLEEAMNSGGITKRIYHKAQVLLAHDYLLNHEKPVRAGDALRRCDPAYFLQDQKEDMAADANYADSVMKLANALVDLGLIDSVPMPRFTQPLGRA
jgi:hypothetical protein